MKNAYILSVKKITIFSSSEIAWAKRKDQNIIFALVTHNHCEICIARKRKIMWQVTQQSVQLNCNHRGMPLRCSRKWRYNRLCKKVFTRRMPLLLWCEKWSLLPAIFEKLVLSNVNNCLQPTPAEFALVPSCWCCRQKKEKKIAMQLYKPKHCDLQGYVFASLWFKLFAVPHI